MKGEVVCTMLVVTGVVMLGIVVLGVFVKQMSKVRIILYTVVCVFSFFGFYLIGVMSYEIGSAVGGWFIESREMLEENNRGIKLLMLNEIKKMEKESKEGAEWH